MLKYSDKRSKIGENMRMILKPHFNEPNMLIKILARPLIDQNMY